MRYTEIRQAEIDNNSYLSEETWTAIGKDENGNEVYITYIFNKEDIKGIDCDDYDWANANVEISIEDEYGKTILKTGKAKDLLTNY